MTESNRWLLAGATVIDGFGGAPMPDTDVLIEVDRVVAVGASANSAAESDDRCVTIDCAGRVVMPGLIDSHCHITFGEPASNDELFFHRPQTISAYLAAFDVQKLLLAGVTGFLDADCIFDLGPALRDAIEAGMVEGPRMATGLNALLTSAGGTAGRLIPESGTVGYARVVGDVPDIVRTVREQIKFGADWIKVHVTGSLPGKAGELTVWNASELKAVCDTAHSLDTPVLAHCRNPESTILAAEAGVELIVHASYIDDSGIEAVVDAGCAVAPTFTFLDNLATHGAKVGAATSQVDIFRGEIEATAKKLRAAYDAGVPLLCGSESGFSLTPYGHWHARELELFVEHLGLTPLEAIACATRNAAPSLRMEIDTVGVIAVDAVADVLVIDGDPSEDISVLGDRGRICEVFSRGRRVDLNRPWPTRSAIAGEKVGLWSAQTLTRDIAFPSDRSS